MTKILNSTHINILKRLDSLTHLKVNVVNLVF